MGSTRDPNVGRDPIAVRIGAVLAEHRRAARLSQAAAIVHTGVGSLAQIERGVQCPSLRLLVSLAESYGTTVAAMCEEAGL